MATKDVVLRFLSDTKGLKKGTSSAGKALGKMGAIGVAAFAAMAAAATAFIASSLKVGASFEKTMTEAKAVSNATVKEYQVMTDKAREMGATTSFSAKEAADSFVLLSRAGQSASESVATIESTMLLAGASSTDLSTSTDAVVASLSQFNLEASESGRVSDVFASAASNSMFSVTGLAQAMKFAGTAGAAFGVSLEGVGAGTMMLRNLGLEASQAGTTYRTALTQMAKVTGAGKAALDKYGLTAEDVNIKNHSFGEIVQTLADKGFEASDAMQLFGSRAGSGMAALIKNAKDGKNNFEKFENSLKNAQGTAKRQYDMMMDTVAGKADIVKSAYQEIQLSVFDAFGGSSKDVLDIAASALQTIGRIIKENRPVLESFIESITAVFASFGSTTQTDIENIEFAVRMLGRTLAITAGAVVTLIGGLKVSFLGLKLSFNMVADGIVMLMMKAGGIVEKVVAGIAKVVGIFNEDMAEGMRDAFSGAGSGLEAFKQESADRRMKTLIELGDAAQNIEDGWGKAGLAFSRAGEFAINAEKDKQGEVEKTTNKLDEQTKAAQAAAAAAAAATGGGSGGGSGGSSSKTGTQSTRTPELKANKWDSPSLSGMDTTAHNLAIDIGALGIALDNLELIGVGTFQALGDGMSNFIVAMSENAKNFTEEAGKLFKNLGKTIMKMIADVVAKMAITGFLNLFTGGTGMLAGFASSMLGNFTRHSGGYIPQSGSYRGSQGEYVMSSQAMQNPDIANFAQMANRNANDPQGDKTINANIPNTPMKPMFKQWLSPNSEFSQAMREMGVKLVTT